MRKTIITTREVIKYSPAEDDYSTDTVNSVIQFAEKAAFKTKELGYDFYEKLKDDVIDVDSIEDYEVKSYSKGEMVLYEGVHYKSDIDLNTGNPDDGNWTPIQKFMSDVNNDLWENGLMRTWLAYKVFLPSIKTTTYKPNKQGLTVLHDSNTSRASVEHRAYLSYKNGIIHDCNDIYELMIDYMKSKNMLPSLLCKDGNSTIGNTRRKRRFHF